MTISEFNSLAELTNDFAVDESGISVGEDGIASSNPPSFVKNRMKEKLLIQDSSGVVLNSTQAPVVDRITGSVFETPSDIRNDAVTSSVLNMNNQSQAAASLSMLQSSNMRVDSSVDVSSRNHSHYLRSRSSSIASSSVSGRETVGHEFQDTISGAQESLDGGNEIKSGDQAIHSE